MNDLVKEASSRKTQIYGLIDPKSINRSIPRDFTVIGTHKREYIKGEVCHGKKVSYRGELVDAARLIQDCIKRGYYALFWNNTQIAVIFKDALFIEHRPFKGNELDLIIRYAKHFGIEKEYFKGIAQDIRHFHKEDDAKIKKLASKYIINQAHKE